VVAKPSKIGKYDVIEVLGRGGMGVVYKATDPHLNRLVAIKMMTGAFSDNPDLLKRFYREAQSTANLQHPNIVTVYDLGDLEGSPYLVMEYLEGETLDAVITSGRALTLLAKINFICDVCQGLAYAHHTGIVHRDIKPGNIMVLKSGGIKIVDFGIAHIGDKTVTRTGQLIGSLGYMSPEQVNGKPIDTRTDIFSAGVVLYQLLTYSLPFEGDSTAATLLKIIHDPPPPLSKYITDVPLELEGVILRALAKDREERYRTVEDLGFDLAQVRDRLKEGMVTRDVSLLTQVSVINGTAIRCWRETLPPIPVRICPTSLLIPPVRMPGSRIVSRFLRTSWASPWSMQRKLRLLRLQTLQAQRIRILSPRQRPSTRPASRWAEKSIRWEGC
jgi:serine/threonine protein kinase